MYAISGPIDKFNNINRNNIEIGRNEFLTLEEDIKNAVLDYKAKDQSQKEEDTVKDLTEDMLEDIINETNERPTMGETPEQSDKIYTSTREEDR